jgi:hypothetical protein
MPESWIGFFVNPAVISIVHARRITPAGLSITRSSRLQTVHFSREITLPGGRSGT